MAGAFLMPIFRKDGDLNHRRVHSPMLASQL